MKKIGIIGDRATVSGFIALGYTVFEAENTADAKEALLRLAEDEEYAIIFIVDRYARELEEEINKYSGRKAPAITVLPDALSREGELSFGMMRIKRNVERAVGADILFRD